MSILWAIWAGRPGEGIPLNVKNLFMSVAYVCVCVSA